MNLALQYDPLRRLECKTSLVDLLDFEFCRIARSHLDYREHVLVAVVKHVTPSVAGGIGSTEVARRRAVGYVL